MPFSGMTSSGEIVTALALSQMFKCYVMVIMVISNRLVS